MQLTRRPEYRSAFGGRRARWSPAHDLESSEASNRLRARRVPAAESRVQSCHRPADPRSRDLPGGLLPVPNGMDRGPHRQRPRARGHHGGARLDRNAGRPARRTGLFPFPRPRETPDQPGCAARPGGNHRHDAHPPARRAADHSKDAGRGEASPRAPRGSGVAHGRTRTSPGRAHPEGGAGLREGLGRPFEEGRVGSFDVQITETLEAEDPTLRQATTDLQASSDEIRQLASDLEKRSWDRVLHDQMETRQLAHRAEWVLIIVSSVTLVLSVLLSFILPRQVVKPLVDLKEAVDHAAAGNYEMEFDVQGDGEVVQLASSVRRLIGHVREQRMKISVAARR
ncbi:MAG: hypothetical protein DMG26_02045 [Acidobacteria bacterium]|nr:MAG: hypothetical protein DMG26_02045 [Acidobacteriota bacterium]